MLVSGRQGPAAGQLPQEDSAGAAPGRFRVCIMVVCEHAVSVLRSAARCAMLTGAFVRGQRHLQSHVPDDEKPLVCGTCDRRFVTASALQCHRRVHSAAARRFQCPLCRAMFEQVTSLREHVRVSRWGSTFSSCFQAATCQ